MTEPQLSDIKRLTSQKMHRSLKVVVGAVFLYAFLFLGLALFDDLVLHIPGHGRLDIALLAGAVGSGLGLIRTHLLILEARIIMIERSLQELKK